MEFIEQIEEIAYAKPQEEKQSELEKASKTIQEERLNREKEFANELQLLYEKYKVSMTIIQPQIQITPNASAILDLVSTTKGLSIPTMTSTQASAIATPKKSLMLYVTDTNGTFTSAGWWGYNGTIWKLILAE